MTDARPHGNLVAALFIVAASVFIALSTLTAKTLGTAHYGTPLHPFQISFGRFAFAFLAIAIATLVLRPRFSSPHWRLHAARTTCGWAGITLMFAAVAFIPMADATAISFLNPVFAMLLAIPILRETVGPIRWFAASVALGGAVILIRPTPESFQTAALLALGAAIALGLEITLIKILSRNETTFQILFFNNLLGLCIASIAVVAFWITPNLAQWSLLAAVGVSMAIAQTFFVNGMARAEASFVAPFGYATLIFAAFFDMVFYGIWPDAITILGAAIILIGAAILAIREAGQKVSKAAG